MMFKSIALSFTISKLGEFLLKRLAILLPELYYAILISNAVSTARHHVQYRIQNRLQHGVTLNFQKMPLLLCQRITDFLQSSALVYCGDQSRSWHGTTVQAVKRFVSEETLATVHSTMTLPTSSPPH